MSTVRRGSDVSADDSVDLMVEPQRKEFMRHTDFDIKYKQNESDLCMYVELDPKNINAIIKQTLKGMVFDDERKLIKNCIFYKKIETEIGKVKGNFHLTYLTYKGITFNVYLNTKQSMRYSRMRIHYQVQDKWVSEWVMGSTTSKQGGNQENYPYQFELRASQIDKVLKDKLLLFIHFEKQTRYSKEFNGLYNSGNICYLNSILQVLYYFVPFRKMIVEKNLKKTKNKNENSVIEKLQQIFLQLMTSRTIVNADDLLFCFEQFNDFPRQQHDIHEFMMSLFDAVENQCSEVKEIWCGQEYQITYSKTYNYKSKQQSDFNEIQLFMGDTKGNNFISIHESLKEVLAEQKLDGLIQHDQHGKIQAFKTRHFIDLPPLLFMSVRRYKYNAKRMEALKINWDISYPDNINLDFMMNTPGANADYILYSVIVHKGLTPNRGHYFSFVNVSKTLNQPRWIEFNDSRVSETSSQRVLEDFTGKKKTEIYLNEAYGKWYSKTECSEETAYMLIYMRTDNFEEYQNIEIQVPSYHIEKLERKLTEEEAKTKTSVKVYIFRDEEDFDPFDKALDLIELKLLKTSTFWEELERKETLISCKVGSLWKVNKKTGKIKRVLQKYGSKSYISIQMIVDFNRGIRQPDYFLIIPKEYMPADDENISLVNIKQISEDDEKSKLNILNRLQVKQMLQNLAAEGCNINTNQNKSDQFFLAWNDYLEVIKE